MTAATRPGRRERGKQERVERILAAARELLREQAGASLTVERIAARAGVAPATVFNLVGTREQIWAALADQALGEVDVVAAAPGDPQERARAIVGAIMDVIVADPFVFRAMLSSWSQSARVLRRDPTGDLVACLRSAADAGTLSACTDVRRLGELISSGLIGLVHQWAAGLVSDRALHRRARDIVDLAFAAARP